MTRHAWFLVWVSLVWIAPLARGAELVRWGNGYWLGGGGTTYLQASGWKAAHAIFPTTAMAISQVHVRTGAGQLGSPVFRVGIQGNGAGDFPDGTWVGGASNYATTALPTLNSWNMVALPAAANLLANTRYHIVVDVITADASNRSSMRHVLQVGNQAFFRPESGVYDTAVGREIYNGSSWSRGHSHAMLAVDTSATSSLGQPYVGAPIGRSTERHARANSLPLMRRTSRRSSTSERWECRWSPRGSLPMTAA